MLPPKLPERLLALELSLSTSPTLPTLTELISLYTVRLTQLAIEHYEALQDPSYQLYQSQLQFVLRKPEIVALLGAKSPTSPRGDHREIVRINPEPPIERSRNIDTLVNTANVQVTGREAGRGIQEQTRRLEGKLRERRAKHKGEGGMGESDKGGGSCFEEELEKLLEKHLDQRTIEESSLLSHYESQLAQLQSCPSTTPVQLQSLHHSLQQSLTSLRSLHSHNKREAIQTLKQRYQLT